MNINLGGRVMTKITFDKFIEDYNKHYQTNCRVIRTDTNEIFGTMLDLYNTDDFELDYDEEMIELY